MTYRKTLKEHDACPDDKRHFQEFCEQIGDPRFDSPIDNVLTEDSAYLNNFEKMHRYLNMSISTKQSREQNRKTRNISSYNHNYAKKGAKTPQNPKTGGKRKSTSPFTGKLEGKNYSPKEWYSMTSEQKQRMRELRKANPTTGQTVSQDTTTTETPTKDAGNQFGRSAHKKAKFADNA